MNKDIELTFCPGAETYATSGRRRFLLGLNVPAECHCRVPGWNSAMLSWKIIEAQISVRVKRWCELLRRRRRVNPCVKTALVAQYSAELALVGNPVISRRLRSPRSSKSRAKTIVNATVACGPISSSTTCIGCVVYLGRHEINIDHGGAQLRQPASTSPVPD